MRRAVLAVALLALTACSSDSSSTAPPTAVVPTPSTGAATTKAGQPPVVWVSGQVARVTPGHVVVAENRGSSIVVRRLAEGATHFFRGHGDSWTPMPSDEVDALDAGTPVCAEALLARGVYLGIQVFVGAACGPRP
jgi:hypothetical protein